MNQIDTTHTELATEINRLHEEVCTGLGITIEQAIRIGELLSERKTQCQRGSWLPWLKANVTFTEQTARRYIRIFQNREKLNRTRGFDLTLKQAAQLVEDSLEREPKPEPEPESKCQAEPKEETKPEIEPDRSSAPTDILPAKTKHAEWRFKYVDEHAVAEVKEALEAGKITVNRAEKIAHWPAQNQVSQISVVPKVKNQIEPVIPFNGEIKTGQPLKPEKNVPDHYMYGIVTADLVGKGFRGYRTENGAGPYQLSPGVSRLEADERRPFIIGGSHSIKHRKNFEKWERYDELKIRQKVLNLLEKINPLQIEEATHAAPAFSYVYNLNVSTDLKELVEMLCADLRRVVDELELKERFGNLGASQ
jgi:Protein of unknown function (DUF3102)